MRWAALARGMLLDTWLQAVSLAQPGSSSVPGTSCWLLHLGCELVTYGDRGAAWPGPAGAILPLLWPPEPLQGWQHLVGTAGLLPLCLRQTLLVLSLQTRKALSGWHPALLGQFVLAGSVVPTREIVFLSQEVQAEALQSLGGDGSCGAACTQHQAWQPQSSCSGGWSGTFSYGPIHSSFLADPLSQASFQPPLHLPVVAQQPSLVSHTWV